MKVGIVGTRGIPATYGGFETFVEELATRLAKRNDISLTVYCDKGSWNADNFKGVNLRFMSTSKSSAPVLYYFLSLWFSIKENDIVLITGSAGSLFYKLKYILNRNAYIVINTDGLEHKRNKWGFLKKKFVHFVENLAIRNSDLLIADSKAIKKYWLDRYPQILEKKILTIEYGAYVLEYADRNYLQEHSLTPDNYYLVVARLEPENNVHLVIEGYKKSNSQVPLIVVGSTSSPNEYILRLKNVDSKGVIFIGGVYDKNKLSALRFYSKAYFHGHSVGGTNPSLLEAMGAGNFVIAHDNEFNREVTDNIALFFKDSDECCNCISQIEKLNHEKISQIKDLHRERVRSYYNWERICLKYLDVFKTGRQGV
jgi:glycosyltransferase involved in cell wall biosynthesis